MLERINMAIRHDLKKKQEANPDQRHCALTDPSRDPKSHIEQLKKKLLDLSYVNNVEERLTEIKVGTYYFRYY